MIQYFTILLQIKKALINTNATELTEKKSIQLIESGLDEVEICMGCTFKGHIRLGRGLIYAFYK